MKKLNYLHRTAAMLGLIMISFAPMACDEDEPEKEDTPEIITRLTLTFTPAGGGDPIAVTATDPDGIGVKELAADKAIDLKINTTYTLTMNLINGLLDPTDEDYTITEEIEKEGDEHQFFFSWSENVFVKPAGTGNIAPSTGAVDYTGGTNSLDKNGLPLGLTTTWKMAGTATTGKAFTVLLKHQPGLKSRTSTSNDGETDVNVAFTINLVN
jgi:hypothetical protein